MKILVCVLSCQKNKHLWDTILARVAKNLIIFTKSETNETWFDKKRRILYLNCADTYECLPEKVVCMIHQILHMEVFRDITHILKIDDHEAVHLTDRKVLHLYNYINVFRSYHYVGQHLLRWSGESNDVREYHFNKVTPNSEWDNRRYKGIFVPWLNGGKTYILSKKAMKCVNSIFNISNLNVLYKIDIYEDLMIAKCLFVHGIRPFELNYQI